MKVNIFSETQFTTKGNGVHTAFLNHIDLLQAKKDVEVSVNGFQMADILHSHSYGPLYFLKGLFFPKRRIYTGHVIPDSIKGSLPAWQFLMPFVRWYMKQVYSFSTVCIAISPRVEEAIRELGANTQIVRINNPIPTDKWQQTAEKRQLGRALLGISPNEFVVLGVGQLQARKGVEDFIDMASAVPEARFVWAGGRPFKAMTEGISRIDERIKSAPDNIQFMGMVDLEQMPLIYAAADLFLFPSYQENCPLAPLEAAACGLPVIFRDLSEYRKLYKHTYLRANNTQEFINLTKQLIEDETFYFTSLYLSEQLVAQFEEQAIRESLINLYHQMMQRAETTHPMWA